MLRPRWSKIAAGTSVWRTCVRLLGTGGLLLAGCSGLDPSIGKLNTDPVNAPDADVGDADTSEGGGTDRFFAVNIRPLVNRPGKGDPTGKGCKGCHYKTEANHTGIDLSGLDLATLGALRLGGGSSGRRIVVAGKPAESVLVQVLKGQYVYANQMPKNGPYWTVDEIRLVETWISEGAKGADDE